MFNGLLETFPYDITFMSRCSYLKEFVRLNSEHLCLSESLFLSGVPSCSPFFLLWRTNSILSLSPSVSFTCSPQAWWCFLHPSVLSFMLHYCQRWKVSLSHFGTTLITVQFSSMENCTWRYYKDISMCCCCKTPKQTEWWWDLEKQYWQNMKNILVWLMSRHVT